MGPPLRNLRTGGRLLCSFSCRLSLCRVFEKELKRLVWNQKHGQSCERASEGRGVRGSGVSGVESKTCIRCLSMSCTDYNVSNRLLTLSNYLLVISQVFDRRIDCCPWLACELAQLPPQRAIKRCLYPRWERLFCIQTCIRITVLQYQISICLECSDPQWSH